MRIFEKCDLRIWPLFSAVLAALAGCSLSIAAEEVEPLPESVIPKPTSNPTGLQIGVNAPEVGALPAGTEAIAKEGAMASADMEWDKAKKAYLQLLQMAPENPLALSNLGAVEFRLGNLEAALDYLERATRAAPAIAQNWLTIGLIQHGRGQSYLALSAFARALHADPGDPRAHNYMGVVIRGLGWASGAETELQRAIALDPAYSDAHFNLAVMYLDRMPPLVELARRHYYAALEFGAKPDPVIEQKLNSTVGGAAPGAPVLPVVPDPAGEPKATSGPEASPASAPIPVPAVSPKPVNPVPKPAAASSLRGRASGANASGKPKK
jgi:hypothetical protein